MPIRDEIVGVLSQAEDQLVSRLQRAIKKREYSDVAELASVSQELHELIQSLHGDLGQPEPTKTPRSSGVSHSPVREQSASHAGRAIKKGYPKFGRDGDHLVKTGWSKKDRGEYRHRVPESTVSAVVSALRGFGSTEFSMGKLTPVHNGKGKAVPSYQVYLVVAWLRACGALQKAGRGGYVAIPERLSGAAVNEHWAALEGERIPEGASTQ